MDWKSTLANMFFMTRQSMNNSSYGKCEYASNIISNFSAALANNFANNINSISRDTNPLYLFGCASSGDAAALERIKITYENPADIVWIAADMAKKFANNEMDKELEDANILILASYALLFLHNTTGKALEDTYILLLLEKVFFDENIKEDNQMPLALSWGALAVMCEFDDYIWEKHSISLSNLRTPPNSTQSTPPVTPSYSQTNSSYSNNQSYQNGQQQYNNRNKGGCYIATAVYGSYDAPEVMILRRYRDERLAQNAFGRLFIKIYYKLSPPIAKKLATAKRINSIVKTLLDMVVRRL